MWRDLLQVSRVAGAELVLLSPLLNASLTRAAPTLPLLRPLVRRHSPFALPKVGRLWVQGKTGPNV